MVTRHQLSILKKLYTTKRTAAGYEIICKVCGSAWSIESQLFTPVHFDNLISKYKVAHPRIYHLLINHKPQFNVTN